MTKQNYFIVSLSWIDFLTLGSLLLSSTGLFFAFRSMLTLSMGLMLLAMFVDMVDGVIARQFKLESEFGKYLDSFCDVFTYLALPLFILFQFGMQDVFSLLSLFTFLTCGFLRLSRFNIIGAVEEAGIKYHLGLQVIWSHLFVVLAFPVWRMFGERARYPLAAILLVISFFMIRNLRFPKPTHYVFQTAVILFVSAVYFTLHAMGIYTP